MTVPGPEPGPGPRPGSAALQRPLLLLVALGLGAWIVVGPLTEAPLQIDEGLHTIGARHFLHDPSDHLVRPDYVVGEWSEWEPKARSYLFFPPTVEALYGGFLAAFGLGTAGFGLPLLLAVLLVAGGLYALGRRLWDDTTGLAAAALFLWSAAAFDLGSRYEAEPFVAAFGVLAAAAVAEGTARRRWSWFAAAGACYGAAFLFKLYLGLVPGVVALGFLVRGLREDRPWRVAGRWLALGVAAVAVGSAHLAWVAATDPVAFDVWLAAYLRPIVERAGVAGQTPAWYYPAVLYRDFAPLAVPLLWVAVALVRRPRHAVDQPRRWLLGTTLFGVLALFLFSKKEALYLYPLLPYVVLVAARGLVQMGRSATTATAPRALGVAGAATGLALVAVLAVWFAGVRTVGFDGAFVVRHTVALTLVAGALLSWRFGRAPRAGRLAVAAIAAVALLWGALTAVDVVTTRRAIPILDEARALAARPELATRPTPPGPGDEVVTFVSSRWHPLSALMWERGRPWYWEADDARPWSAQVRDLAPTIRLFHIDRRFRACAGCPPTPAIHAEILAWLRENAEDVTAEIERRLGRSLPGHVFRRSPAVPSG